MLLMPDYEKEKKIVIPQRNVKELKVLHVVVSSILSHFFGLTIFFSFS